MVVPWLLAPAVTALLHQLNQRAPNRSKASDGFIGDAAHQRQGSASDHNPHVVHLGQPYVTAGDFTNDPRGGLDCNWLKDVFLRTKPRRIKYFIWQGVLYDSRALKANNYRPWSPQPSSEHFGHLHVSVMSDPALFLDASPWDLGGGTAVPDNEGDDGDMFKFVGVWDPAKKMWASDLALLHGPHFTGGFKKSDVDAMRADPLNGHIPLMGVTAAQYHDMRKKGDLAVRQAEVMDKILKLLEQAENI